MATTDLSVYRGKVVWITGASSGIGEAFAQKLHLFGAKLILSARTAEELNPVVRKLQGSIGLSFDVSDIDSLPEMVEQANSIFGRIDILFNNAGVTQRSLAKDTDIKVYRQLIDTDLMAPIALTQLVAPQMIERGEGKIVAIASITGKFGVPLRTAYCAAKHGMFGYFDALRTEVGYRGVDIHVVAPGSVRTDLARNAMTSSGDRFGKTDSSIESGYEASYVSDKVLRRIARGEKEIILVRGRERMMLIFRKFFPEIFFRKLNDAAPKFVQEFVASQDG